MVNKPDSDNISQNKIRPEHHFDNGTPDKQNQDTPDENKTLYDENKFTVGDNFSENQQEMQDNGKSDDNISNIAEQKSMNDLEAKFESATNKELELARKEMQNYKEKWLMALADNENRSKRAQKDLEDARNFSIASFANDVLEVSDTLSRALKLVEGSEQKNLSNEQSEKFIDGIKLTAAEINKILKKHNIETVNPQGEKFDPQMHQAIQNITSDEHDKGTVIDVIQVGYKISNRILRPALVTVSSKSG